METSVRFETPSMLCEFLEMSLLTGGVVKDKYHPGTSAPLAAQLLGQLGRLGRLWQ